jgi:hypothetical protein
LSMASTRVVLPWSTWAMMAMLRMFCVMVVRTSQALAILLNWGAALLRPYGMAGADKNSCWCYQQPGRISLDSQVRSSKYQCNRG